MNKKKALLYFLSACFILTSNYLLATNFNGSTGLIYIPTAEALRYKECNVGFDYLLTQDKTQIDYKYKFNMGIYENVELGFSGGKYPEEGVFVNMKYYLMSTEERYPLKIAIGIDGLTSEKNTSAYMISSKRFNPEMAGHFGFNALFNKKVTPGVLAGLSIYVTEIIELITDISGDGDEYTLNIGGKVSYSEYGTFQTSIIDVFDLNKPKIIIGITQRNFL
eukprot:COSAG01_NODE_2_length_63927_cov_1357.611941_42_plen_221_part_00